MSAVILKPDRCEEAYKYAAEAFRDLYIKVTGNDIAITEADDGVSDLIVIGSDSVNDFLMNEILNLRLGSLNIRYGTDDYCIRSLGREGRKILVLAGGRGRSTLYAVYGYFERFLGCRYFWDGDIIPQSESIPMDDIDITESPRFEYRGLRYFAHRGLKRFQAEHWSFEDWKQELDWLVKKRLNFFMLRIGMDDIWQRAFPETVPYPEGFNTVKWGVADGFNDRTDFWTLEYRGELKKRVLEYARGLDLIYPVDCGTMTHWYSRTPKEFLERKKPSFITQEIAQYTESDTGKVFDFTKKENLDYYMKLTEAMVNEHEKSSALFHTIGLGERLMYADKRKNFALKLIAYRRIAENIRQRYPNSKLMLASWDFIGWWSSQEVKNLIAELDPERTVILDYTSEVNDPDIGFANWGVVGKFPWIFGLFHAFESESELRGPYDRSDERLKLAAEDPYCKGMVLWPELSHSDPLVLEYLAQNAWSPLGMTIEQIAKRFCDDRYGEFARDMNDCWQKLLPFIKLGDWGGYSRRQYGDERYFEYFNGWYAHQDIWAKPLRFAESFYGADNHYIEFFEYKASKTEPTLKDAIYAVKKLARSTEALKSRFVLRDAVDMARTVLGRMINFLLIKCFAAAGNTERLSVLKKHYFEALSAMERLLSLVPDFSLYHTLEQLRATAETNPEFEPVLKRNIANGYCSQPAYELVSHLFKEEAEALFEWLFAPEGTEKPDFAKLYENIFARFESKRLRDLQPEFIPTAENAVSEAAECIERLYGLMF